MSTKKASSAPAPYKSTFEDFYYTEVLDTAKSNASKMISGQFEKMREALKWPETAPQDRNVSIVDKSRNISFSSQMEHENWPSLVSTPMIGSAAMHRNLSAVPVPSHVVPKRAARVEKNFMASPPRSRGRSKSPNRHYHFHGDKLISPEQMRKELYLHHDMFLTSQDDDVAQTVLHHTHPHAANHPELEFKQFKPVSSNPSSRLSTIATAPVINTPSPAARPKSANPVITLPDRSNVIRTLGSSSSDLRNGGTASESTAPQMHTFRGLRTISTDSFRNEMHLHHDVFLASQDDAVAEAVTSITRRRQESVTRYPHESEVQIDYSLKPDIKNARPTVPSHVVKALPAEKARSASSKSLPGARSPAVETSATPVAEGDASSPSAPVMITPTSTLVASAHPATQPATQKSPKTAALALDSQYYTSAEKKLSQASQQSLTGNTEGARGTSPTTVVDLSPKNLPAGGVKSAPAGAHTKTQTHTRKVQNHQVQTPVQAQGVPPKGPTFDFQSATLSFTQPTSQTTSQSITTPANNKNTNNTNNTNKSKDVEKTHYLASAVTTASKKSPPSATPKPTHRSPTVGAKVAYSRPLTAAEHAAAQALSAKLTAANLAYNREGGAEIAPFPKMSRALSLLVYSVRDEAGQE